jgi:hypothetical protein
MQTALRKGGWETLNLYVNGGGGDGILGQVISQPIRKRILGLLYCGAYMTAIHHIVHAPADMCNHGHETHLIDELFHQ